MSRTSETAYSAVASFRNEGSKAIGILCAIVIVVLFAGFTLISRLGFSSALKLPDIAALRFGIAGVILLPIFLKRGLSGLPWYRAAGLAFAGGLGFALFAYTGFYLAPASHGAVLLHGTLPLSTFAIVYLTSREKTKLAQTIGFSIIALGIATMTWDSLSGATTRQLVGDGALLLASISWSSYGVAVKRLGLVPLHAASIVAFFSMCFFFPVYLMLPGNALFLAGWRDLLIQGVFQGVFLGVVSIFVYTRAVASLGAKETALFTAAVPCITTAAAIPLLSEMPGVAVIIGVVLVTAGMVIAMRAS
ncbi:MAG: DMT family transporter [Sulfurifustaceae bacterium]